MPLTVKLDSTLDAQLRRRAAAAGCTASDVVRAALQAYLAVSEPADAQSAFDRGQDLFGRFGGAPSLAAERKRAWSEITQQRHEARGATPHRRAR